MKRYIIMLFIAGVTTALVAEEQPKSPEATTDTTQTAKQGTGSATTGAISCQSGADTRKIEVTKSEAGGCEVIYTKENQANSVANAQYDMSYCDQVRDKIKTNLENAGFKCE